MGMTEPRAPVGGWAVGVHDPSSPQTFGHGSYFAGQLYSCFQFCYYLSLLIMFKFYIVYKMMFMMQFHILIFYLIIFFITKIINIS